MVLQEKGWETPCSWKPRAHGMDLLWRSMTSFLLGLRVSSHTLWANHFKPSIFFAKKCQERET